MANTENAPEMGVDASPARTRLSDEERKRRAYEADRRRRERERAAKRGEHGPALIRPAAAKTEEERQSRLRAKSKRTRERHAEKIKARKKTSYKASPAATIERSRAWYAANKERAAIRSKERYNAEENTAIGRLWRARNAERVRQYRASRIDHAREYANKRRKTNLLYRITCILRSRLNCAMRRCGAEKSDSTMRLVGCSATHLKQWIEVQFQPGMSWGNQGLGWHVDHRRPLFTFNLLNHEQQKIAFHYTNLRPLWAEDNMARSRINWRESA